MKGFLMYSGFRSVLLRWIGASFQIGFPQKEREIDALSYERSIYFAKDHE